MYPLNQLKTLVSCGRDPARSLPFRRGFLLIPLILAAFTLAQVQAAVNTPDPGSVPATNTADGDSALASVTASGTFNAAFGFFSLLSNTDADFNTGLGAGTLLLNNASDCTAVGAGALLTNSSGINNTACGGFALFTNSTGEFNNAVGASSLLLNVDGDSNNALGESALFANVNGSANTAIGDVALATNGEDGNLDANANVAVGAGALFSNLSGDSNNAVGFNSLGANFDGLFNNAVGFDAMADNVSGAGNVAVGDSAGAGVEGDFNIYIGAFAGPAPSPAPVAESETIRIGDVFNVACFIGGIRYQTASGGVAVFIDGNGKLGTVTSSARFKDEIKPMDKASESVLALKPVTFRYKHELDPDGIPQFGLVAEQVEQVNPDLVVHDRDGKVSTVRYEAVNAMLLNEFLKEHQKVEKLECTVAMQEKDFKATIAQQQKQIEALTATVQKVRDQVALSKPATQLVANP